jgi:aminopeptidase N
MKKLSFLLAALLVVLVLPFSASCGGKNKQTSYQINCTLEKNFLTASQTVDFYNDTGAVLSELKFNLFGNAFRSGAKHRPISAQYTVRAYPNGINYGDMQVKSVACNGEELPFSVGGEDLNILTVNLPSEIYPDERALIEIKFNLNLANVIARTGYTDKVVNLANFYPILCPYDEQNGFYECVYYSSGDPFYSEVANYTVTLTADEKFVVASSGKLLERTVTGDKATSTFTAEKVRSFAFVLSKDFESITKTVDGIEVNYYFYDDKTPEKSLEYAEKSLKLFNEKFGKYPYEHYSVVQTEFIQGGMEYPALVMISDDLEENAYGEVIVHETAHQWWQTAVGNNEVEYGFLDEGLAEYSVVVFYENYPEYGMDRKTLISSSEKTYKVFCSVYDKFYGKVNTVMKRSLKDFTSEYEYVNMAYIKPCIMYDYLRTTVGDDAFFKGLKDYYKKFCFKNATPDDLVGVFEKCGTDTNGFFESFFDGKVII